MIDIETYRQETDALFSKMHELIALSDQRSKNEITPHLEKEREHQLKAVMAIVAAVTVAALANPVAGIALCAMAVDQVGRSLKHQHQAWKIHDEILTHNRDAILCQEKN